MEVLVAHFVEIFEFSKIVGLFLDCVVCEMNILVIQIVKVEFSGARPDVAVFIEISFKILVNACHQTENAEVKFPSIYKQWVVNILLDNHVFFAAYKTFDFVHGVTYVDSNTSI